MLHKNEQIQKCKNLYGCIFFTHVGGPVYRTAVLLVKSIDVGPSGEQESHHLKVAKNPKQKKKNNQKKQQQTNKQGMRKNE